MYISEFQSACIRLGLSFTMPPMQMEIDDLDDDCTDAGNARDAVVIWSQDDLGDGGGDAIPGGSAAAPAARAHSMSSQMVMQVSSSDSDGKMPRSSGHGRGRSSRGRGRNPGKSESVAKAKSGLVPLKRRTREASAVSASDQHHLPAAVL